QVRTLQMHPMRAEIPDLKRRFAAQALLNGQTPLLDVLRGSVRFDRRETNGRHSKHRLREIKSVQRWSKVVALLSDRKYIRHIVPLVAPRVEVHWRKENSVRAMNHRRKFRQVLRKTQPWCKILSLGIQQPLWVSVLPADERLRRAVDERQVAVRVTNIHQRVHEFIPQADLDRGVPGTLKSLLREPIQRPLPQLHLRNASLYLFHGWQAQQKTRKPGSRSIIRCGLRSKSICELIVAAVLKESPHRPNVSPEAGSKFQSMTALLPAQHIARFNDGVPRLHRRSRITVAHSGIALHVEPWRSPCSWPAIANSLNSELRHDVVRVRPFRGVAHGKPRNAERHHIYHARAHDSVPRNVSLLR